MSGDPTSAANSSSGPEVLDRDKVLAGRYRLLRPLGDGAMAHVWLVADEVSSESVALKLLSGEAVAHAAVLRREFERLARLEHPNVVRVYDFGVIENERPYFTMDWIDGRPIDAALPKGDWESALALAAGALAGLGAIHAGGLVHGDIKPANILVVGSELDESSVRVVDLGLASRVGETTRPRGTLGFAAPEVLDGTPPDGAADLYSMGATLYAALAGRAPFEAKSVSALVKMQTSGPPDVQPLRELGVPQGVIRALQLLLDPDPRRRPPSAHDAAQEFAGAVPRRQRRPRRKAPSAAAVPGGASRPALARGSLVGRSVELSAAERALDTSTPPRLVVGPSGAGRTRFLRELGVRAEVAGGRATILSCAGRPDAGIEWKRRIQAMLGLEGPASWTRLIEALPAQGPVLLGLEDLQLAGEESLAVAREALASSFPPNANVILSWAEPAPSGSEAFERFRLLAAGPWIDRTPERIELRALGASDTADLVRTLLGGAELPEVEAAVIAHSGGLPSWIDATLEHWIDAGTLRQQDGVWFVQPGADLGSPAPAFEEVLRKRISALSEDAQAFLVAVADLGGEAAAAAALGSAEVDSDALKEAVESGLAFRETSTGGEAVRLAYQLSGAVAREQQERGRYRRQVTRTAERIREYDALGAAKLLVDAREFQRARSLLTKVESASLSPPAAWKHAQLNLASTDGLGVTDSKTVQSAALAADRALRFQESAQLWERFAGLLPIDSMEQTRALLRSAEARRWVGEHGEAGRILSDVEEKLRRLPASDETVASLRSSMESERAWLLTIRGEQSEAESAARRALELAPSTALRERFTAWNRLAVILPAQSRLSEAQSAVREAMQIAHQLGDDASVLRAIGNAIAIVRFLDDVREEESLLQTQLRISQRQENLQVQCRALSGLAGLEVRVGTPGTARAALLKAETACRLAGDALILATVLNNAARLELRVGQLKRAFRLSKAALHIAVAVDIAEIKSLAWNRIGIIRGLLGARGAAIRAHRRAMRGVGRRNRGLQAVFPLVYLADLALDEHRLGTARRLIRRARELSGSNAVLSAWVRRTEARLAAVGPLDERTAPGSSSEIQKESPADIEARGALLEARAFTLIASGELGPGLASFEESAALYEEHECLVALARLKATGAAALAHHAADRAPDATALAHRWMTESAALFERMHARPPVLRELPALRDTNPTSTEIRRMAENQAQASALFEISQLINSMLDFPELLHRSLEIAVKRLGAERGLILLADRETGELTPVARHGELDEEAQSDALQISTGIVRKVVDTGHTFRSEDVEADPRLTSNKSVFELSLRSVLCAALRMRGDVIGTIYLQNRTARRSFTDADVAFLESFSNLVAIAIENSRLHEGLRQANEALVSENASLRQEVTGSFRFANLVGRSREMGKVQALIERFAQSDADVLIQGETGTGKELIAKTIHYNSPRKERPFLTVSCVALPETLIESELFGIEDHVATGVRARPGIFERAEGGSVLLDEIGDMPLSMQARLLRVLQEREFSRVGGRRTYRMNVRILAATNADLRERVREGRFRPDLYFRVNRLVIQLPHLRDRKSDLPLLAKHFAEQFCERMGQPVPRFSSELLDVLGRSSWFGNVRELEHYIERLLVICDGSVLYPRVLPDDLEEAQGSATSSLVGAARATGSQSLAEALASVERDMILEAIKRAGGNRSRAARSLGMAEPTLRYRLKRLGVPPQGDHIGS